VGESSATPIVHLVDDDASMLVALSRLLTVAGYAAQTFPSAAHFLAGRRPEARGCLIVDLRMPGMSGLELQAQVAAGPNPLPVVFLTAHGDIPTSVHAVKGGAEDFLTKPVSKDALLGAVDRALARDAEAFAQRQRRNDLRERLDSLTRREREVLAGLLAGKLNKEIAADLGTTERTVKAHRASIMEKLRAQSPAELGLIAQEANFVLH
jgi:two-component system response regulator FixJ